MEAVSIAHNNKRARWIIAVCVVVCVTVVLGGFPLLLGVVPTGAQTVDAATLRAAAESLLAVVPSDLRTASCELANNPALPCPTITKPNGSVAQADGALDLLTRDLSPQPPLLQAASSLLPDPRVSSTASKLLVPLLRPPERVATDRAHKAPSGRTMELTAPRVKYEMAPFDHPELSILNGSHGDIVSVTPSDPLGLFSLRAIAHDRIAFRAVGTGGIVWG